MSIYLQKLFLKIIVIKILHEENILVAVLETGLLRAGCKRKLVEFFSGFEFSGEFFLLVMLHIDDIFFMIKEVYSICGNLNAIS